MHKTAFKAWNGTMKEINGRSPAESAVTSRYLVMPDQANPMGTVFGGVIMAWIDMVAAMAAQRHARTEVVTVAVDSIDFKEPILVGDHVELRASVNYVGKTSMEVGVQVVRERPFTNESIVATTAHLVFVAIDKNSTPVPVPPVLPVTDEENRRFGNALKRVALRQKS